MSPPVPAYNAVVTTGIYCRPDCSARPAARNVIAFPLATAAEAAGFRPCHRCRPYRTSEPGRWLDSPDLVCRAVQLIVDGALDTGGEDALARRLGISARHLRRLFVSHVGATPDQVARSRRAHFARRLLDDTDLAVTDIAFAAGFGSVRQMNRAMLDVFRARPTELRARRRRSDRLVADGGLALRVPYAAPVDCGAVIDFFAPRAIPGVEVVDGRRYRRTIGVDGAPGVVEIEAVPAGETEHGELRLRLHLPRWDGLLHLTQRVRRLFDLDSPVETAAEHLRADPDLAPLVDRFPGLRLPGAWDPFEMGIRALLGQQVTVAGATTLASRLVTRFGTPVPGLSAFGLSHLFPTPATLAAADLDGLGVPGARTAAIRGFAAAVRDGDVDLDGHRSLDDLAGGLEAVRGIGPWTAQYIALRLGERDAFPAGDIALRKAYAAARGSAAVSGRELETAAERWRPWRGYAAMYLWSAAAAVSPRSARSR